MRFRPDELRFAVLFLAVLRFAVDRFKTDIQIARQAFRGVAIEDEAVELARESLPKTVAQCDQPRALRSHFLSGDPAGFAEADNQLFYNLGVDNVSILATSNVPEPTSLLLLGVGLAGIRVLRRSRT